MRHHCHTSPLTLLPRNAKSTASFKPRGYDHHITVTLSNCRGDTNHTNNHDHDDNDGNDTQEVDLSSTSSPSPSSSECLTLEQKLYEHFALAFVNGNSSSQSKETETGISSRNLMDLIMDHINVERLVGQESNSLTEEDGDCTCCSSNGCGNDSGRHVNLKKYGYEREVVRRPAITSVELMLCSEEEEEEEENSNGGDDHFRGELDEMMSQTMSNKRGREESNVAPKGHPKRPKLAVMEDFGRESVSDSENVEITADFSVLPKEIVLYIMQHCQHRIENFVNFSNMIGRFTNDTTCTYHILFPCLKFKGDLVLAPQCFQKAEWRLLLAQVRDLRFSALQNYSLVEHVISHGSKETMPMLQRIYHKGHMRPLAENRFLAERVKFASKSIYASDPTVDALLDKFPNVVHLVAEKLDKSDILSVASSKVEKLNVFVRSEELMRMTLFECRNVATMTTICGTFSNVVDRKWFSDSSGEQIMPYETNLRKLEVTCFHVGAVQIEQVPIIPSLTRLDVTRFFRIRSVRGISQMNQLTQLCLEMRDVSKGIEGIRELAQCTQLVVVTVKGGGILDRALVDALCTLSQHRLQYLTLQGGATDRNSLELGDQSIALLCEWHPRRHPNALVQLHVDDHTLTANSIVTMLHPPHLRHVHIKRATFPWRKELTDRIISRGLLDTLQITHLKR